MIRGASAVGLVALGTLVVAGCGGTSAAVGTTFDAHPEDAADSSADAASPRSLFNGVDFSGWDRYLGVPTPGAAPLGLDNDPLGVYSVVSVDGEPAIRVSGQVFGAVISQQELCDFHLSLEYRWGTVVWPGLPGFDSGVMYLSTGPLGAVNAGGPALSNPIGNGGFMVSIEYQLTLADVGGMYNLGPISFQPGPRAQLPDVPGAWNRIDIIVAGGVATHLINGQEITTGSGFTVAWPGQPATPLTCGKLQLQSEGAEIFFRRIQLL
jgi:hypothetical protein